MPRTARSGSRSMYRFVRPAALRNVRNVLKVLYRFGSELVNYRNTDARHLLFLPRDEAENFPFFPYFPHAAAEILSLASVVSGLGRSKNATSGKSVFVWAYPVRGTLNAVAPIRQMKSRRFMPASKDHGAAV